MLGTVRTTLRPLKFAFLVHPRDRRGLREAIELNTVLWGGQFNPIVPTYKRLPAVWRGTGRVTTARDAFTGYIEAFDPDYVVPIGKIAKPPFPVGHRTVLSKNELLGEFEETGRIGYGIGLFDILRHFVEKELKFERRVPLRVVLTERYQRMPLFLASALGALPSSTESELREHWTDVLNASWRRCEGESYAELLDGQTLVPRRLSSLFISGAHGGGWGRHDCVYVLDASSVVDIIDFWNLRAIGWNVVAVPVQLLDRDNVRALAKGFIEANFFPLQYDRSRNNRTTILNSENVGDEEVDKFVDSLEIRSPGGFEKQKIVLQRWYPRIWDPWARHRDGAGAFHPQAATQDLDIPEDTRRLRLRTLDPEFMDLFGSSTNTAFANMIDMKLYGANDLVAEVIPEGGDTLSRAIDGIGFEQWRFSRSGMTYLSSQKDWTIDLNVPDAERVFVEWFREHDWSVALSSSGRIAKQACLALGGSWGVGILTDEGMVKLLDKMSDGRNMRRKAFLGEIRKIVNKRKFPVRAEGFVKRLTDDRVFRLGLELQCPVCMQRSWYSLEDINYKLLCVKCLERFDVPSHSAKELVWSYRSFGPFSLPNYAQGSYPVLLTYYFFSRKLAGATTTIMSFSAEKGQRKLEADLGLFFNHQRFGRTSTDLIFAECKSYGSFKRRDMERLCYLGAEFPGAILVFATLRTKLSTTEKRMLRRIANRGRKYSDYDRNHNPVLVLTGIELFGHERPPECWKDGGEKFEKIAKARRGYRGILELCDCTQQLHLDMDSYYEWLDSRLERRLGRKR